MADGARHHGPTTVSQMFRTRSEESFLAGWTGVIPIEKEKKEKHRW